MLGKVTNFQVLEDFFSKGQKLQTYLLSLLSSFLPSPSGL